MFSYCSTSIFWGWVIILGAFARAINETFPLAWTGYVIRHRISIQHPPGLNPGFEKDPRTFAGRHMPRRFIIRSTPHYKHTVSLSMDPVLVTQPQVVTLTSLCLSLRPSLAPTSLGPSGIVGSLFLQADHANSDHALYTLEYIRLKWRSWSWPILGHWKIAFRINCCPGGLVV